MSYTAFPSPNERAKSMSTTPTVHTCPECGKTFPTPQGLGAHRNRTHGVTGTSKTHESRREQQASARKVVPVLTPRQAARHPAAVSPFVSHTQDMLEDLAEPLREQLSAIESRLSDLDGEAKELREARMRINGVLARLVPQEPKRPAARPHRDNAAGEVAQRNLQEKVEAVRSVITTDPRFADGFTSNRLADWLTDVVPRGLSTKSAREVLERLRDQNVVRHDRVVKGGGMQFKLVTSLDGDGGDTDG